MNHPVLPYVWVTACLQSASDRWNESKARRLGCPVHRSLFVGTSTHSWPAGSLLTGLGDHTYPFLARNQNWQLLFQLLVSFLSIWFGLHLGIFWEIELPKSAPWCSVNGGKSFSRVGSGTQGSQQPLVSGLQHTTLWTLIIIWLQSPPKRTVFSFQKI